MPPALQPRYREVLAVLADLTLGEQLEVACQVLVRILVEARLREEEAAGRGDADRLCEAVEEWLQQKVATLRRA